MARVARAASRCDLKADEATECAGAAVAVESCELALPPNAGIWASSVDALCGLEVDKEDAAVVAADDEDRVEKDGSVRTWV